MEQAIRDLLDKQEISEVLFRYARAVDRKDFGQVAQCYFDDAVDEHGRYCGPIDGLVQDMVHRHQTIDSSLHYITNILIDLHGDSAEVESYCLCYLRQRPEEAGREQELSTIKCRYVDRFERRDGRWGIAHRKVVFDEVQNSSISNALPDSWIHAVRGPEDPVFESSRSQEVAGGE
ncbi:nuclear transport factor 2 family protein [Dactylosporangium sp. CA-233914]|uniref:nuclear transport factor 2 family protein n=1 Tax=Dactylosporangium sp. CA-233914 TaxID=3239934 RepID=UPI003D90584E